MCTTCFWHDLHQIEFLLENGRIKLFFVASFRTIVFFFLKNATTGNKKTQHSPAPRAPSKNKWLFPKHNASICVMIWTDVHEYISYLETVWLWSYCTCGFTTNYTNSDYHHLRCEFESSLWRVVLITTSCDKVCQWLAGGRWFSPVNKTDRHDITELVFKVALNTMILILLVTLTSLVHLQTFLLIWILLFLESLSLNQDVSQHYWLYHR